MSSKSPRQRKLAIQNVRVFDGQQIGEPSTVYIENGLIAQHVEDAEVIDGRGGILLPGLIDAHMHLDTERELRDMLRYGVTTALDMATWPPSKIEGLRGLEGPATDFRTPGAPATAPGSMHSVVLPINETSLVRTPEDAVRFVQARLAENVDYIKVVADVPGPDQQSLDAIVAEAHRHHKLVVAHASALRPFHMARDAGADVLTHAPIDKALDDQTCRRMVEDGCVSVPTLVMMEAVTGPPGWAGIWNLLSRPVTLFNMIKVIRKSRAAGQGKPAYQNARASVAAMHRAGVPILAGTDAHREATSPFDVQHGESLHRELELLVDAGLSPLEVLQAATSLPAKHFGLPDRGVVEVGKRADLVLLTENPIEDIRATRSIARVWCAGVEVGLTPR
jgi:imidazolonepropionase-like amidohydrolase